MNMIKIYELKTQNGRLFRVLVSNRKQELRLFKMCEDSQNKYERFISIECAVNGIHDLKQFELLCNDLV